MVNTPYYKIDYDVFEENIKSVMDAFDAQWDKNTMYGYSVKTNHYQGLIKYAYEKHDWFVETVSPDEYNYALKIGTKKNRIIFNGPCKGETLKSALLNNSYINLDNLDEVKEFCKINTNPMLENIGVRINFDLEKECPDETTAGKYVSRFGIDVTSSDFEKAVKLLKENGLQKIGLHLHTSTKTRSLKVFEALANMAVQLKEKYELSLSFVDMGGGFFGGQVVDGKPTMPQYAKSICDILKKSIDPKETVLILEPGASVIATSVTYITKVINIRDIRDTRIVTLDGTLLHINPFMAKRNQPFEFYGDEKRKNVEKQILCGCTCMENDRFAKLKDYQELKVGDLLEFKYAGAYTMAFNSNFIVAPPKILDVN